MSQASSPRKCKRLVALCPDDMHAAFLRLADRTGESAGMILRGLVSEAIDRARRGEPIVPGLTAGAPSVTAEG